MTTANTTKNTLSSEIFVNIKATVFYSILLMLGAISFNGCAQDKLEKQDITKYILQPDSTMVQEEVCAILSKKNELVVAWVDRKKGTNEKYISYTATYDNMKKWYPVTIYNPKDYIWTGNPALAEDDAGNIYMIAMSNDFDGKKLPTNGLFELCHTSDGGKTWSEWKPIVKNVKKNKDLADKPTLIAKGNGELYLSFINFNMKEDNFLDSKGDVIFMKSKDMGVNWSDKLTIVNNRGWKPSSIVKAFFTGGADFGEQGPALSFYKGRILLSFGSYQKNGIWLATSNDDGNSFSVNKISSLKINTPITKLNTNNLNLITVLAYEAHEVGKIYYLKSKDDGKTFIKEQISKDGSLASGVIGKDNTLNFIWNEKRKETIDTKYMTVKYNKAIVKSFFSEKKINPNFFIGAYQDLLIDRNNIIHALWIDWSQNGGRLNYSQLK